MTFTSNWTILDMIRTFLDRSAKDGVLQPQDDIVDPFDAELELPVDRFEQALAEQGCELFDHRQTPRKKGTRGDGRAWGTRKLAKCTGICWHQTACVFHDVRRTLSIPAHMCIMPNGDVVLLHPLRAYVPHGHACNSFTIGVEVMCRAAGIEGNPRTFWRSPGEKHGWHSEVRRNGKVVAKKRVGRDPNHPGKWHPPKSYDQLVHEATDPQLASCELVADYITAEIERQATGERAKGEKVPGIVAELFHRNGRDDRTSDPGSRIAHRVKLICERHRHEYGAPRVGSGSLTPQAWGGALGVRYSGGTRGF